MPDRSAQSVRADADAAATEDANDAAANANAAASDADAAASNANAAAADANTAAADAQSAATSANDAANDANDAAQDANTAVTNFNAAGQVDGLADTATSSELTKFDGATVSPSGRDGEVWLVVSEQAYYQSDGTSWTKVSDAMVSTGEVGAANGVASLDGNATNPLSERDFDAEAFPANADPSGFSVGDYSDAASMVQAAINQVSGNGGGRVVISSDISPYDATAVTFDSSVVMISADTMLPEGISAYGAGEGVESSAAIQAAVDKTTTGKVQIDTPTDINTQITVPSQRVIRGDWQNEITIVGIQDRAIGFVQSGESGIMYENVHINGGGLEVALITFEGGNTDYRVEGCYLHNAIGALSYGVVNNRSEHFAVSDNRIEEVSRDSIQLKSCRHGVITDNVIRSTGGDGAGIDVHRQSGEQIDRHIIVSANTLELDNNKGMTIQGEELSIQNNSVYCPTNRAFEVVDPCDGPILIQGNSAFECTNGVYSNADVATARITNNTIRNAKETAILFDAGAGGRHYIEGNVIIAANTSGAAGAHAIRCDDGQNWVNGNSVTETTAGGNVVHVFQPSGLSGTYVAIGSTLGLETTTDIRSDRRPYRGNALVTSAYTTANVTADRDLDADNDTVAQVADVLGTLIDDLKANDVLA